MKKVLLAFDGKHFSEGAFEFARKLNELQPILLTGVFLPASVFSSMWTYTDAITGIYAPMIDEEDTEKMEQNIEKFEKHCRNNDIDYRVHKGFSDYALPNVEKESIFADLLIIGSEVFFENKGTKSPNNYLQDALHSIKCAAVLVPEKFDFPESIVLAYDGSDDSVFAIKQFAYLFPELCNKEVLLVYASEDKDADFPDKIEMEELAARHFSNLTLCKLDINPGRYFSTWISEKKSALLVSGSYKRSGVSQLFKKSFIKDVIAKHELPIFVSHH
jgi:nucleotide-binding universal stress UspA family protein